MFLSAFSEAGAHHQIQLHHGVAEKSLLRRLLVSRNEGARSRAVLPGYDDVTTPVDAFKALRCSRPMAVPLLAESPPASL